MAKRNNKKKREGNLFKKQKVKGKREKSNKKYKQFTALFFQFFFVDDEKLINITKDLFNW